MAVQETSNQKNPAGLYRHPESGNEQIVKNHPKFGSSIADGLVRVGYQYVGPAKTSRLVKPTEDEPKVTKKGE